MHFIVARLLSTSKLESLGYIFAAGSTGLSLCVLSISAAGSKQHVYSETKCIMTVQGHPTSLILVKMESTYATSY